MDTWDNTNTTSVHGGIIVSLYFNEGTNGLFVFSIDFGTVVSDAISINVNCYVDSLAMVQYPLWDMY